MLSACLGLFCSKSQLLTLLLWVWCWDCLLLGFEVNAEIFSSTIHTSTCRVDVGHFTFADQNSYNREPSLGVDVRRTLVCRVPADNITEGGDITTLVFDPEFQAAAVQQHLDQISECLFRSNVYFIIAPLAVYSDIDECILPTDTTSIFDDTSMLKVCLELMFIR